MAGQNNATPWNVVTDPIGTYAGYATKGVQGAFNTAGVAIGEAATIFTVAAGTIWIVNLIAFILLVYLVLKFGPKLLKELPKVIPI